MQPASMGCKIINHQTMYQNSQLKNLSNSKRVCQICEFEGRGRRRTGVNYCPNHHIRACTLKSPDPRELKTFIRGGVIGEIDLPNESNNWLCSDSSLTCWEKAHSYYIPNGLFRLKDVVNFNSKESPTVDFNVVSKINWSSSLAKERKNN